MRKKIYSVNSVSFVRKKHEEVSHGGHGEHRGGESGDSEQAAVGRELRLGQLPKGWVEVPVDDVTYFQEGPGLRKYQFDTDGIPFLNIRTFRKEKMALR